MWVQSLRLGFDPWEGKIPWRRAWQSTLVVLPDKSHGQRGLAGCSPWGHKELDMTEHTHMPCPSRKGMNTPEGDSEMGGRHCHCSFRGHRPGGQSCLLLGFRGPGCPQLVPWGQACLAQRRGQDHCLGHGVML